MHYPKSLIKLIALLKKFPGVGTRGAERFAFSLLDWPEEKRAELTDAIKNIPTELALCQECGALLEALSSCPFCQNSAREQMSLCLVACVKDVFAIEQTREFHGLYHVLGTLLSPLQGTSLSPAMLETLKTRIQKRGINELIFAFDSTIEGDATALFLKRELAHLTQRTFRLALGLPMGSALDFIDKGTLARAFAGRHPL